MCPDLNTESRDISSSKLPMKPIYAKLMGILKDTDFYCPILVDKNLSATNKYTGYQLLEQAGFISSHIILVISLVISAMFGKYQGK